MRLESGIREALELLLFTWPPRITDTVGLRVQEELAKFTSTKTRKGICEENEGRYGQGYYEERKLSSRMRQSASEICEQPS